MSCSARRFVWDLLSAPKNGGNDEKGQAEPATDLETLNAVPDKTETVENKKESQQ
jgi:hypothetical protein